MQVGLWVVMAVLAAGPGRVPTEVTVTVSPELPTGPVPDAPPMAAPEVARPPQVPSGQPVWVRRPSPSNISRAYPPRALQEAVEGRAIVECVADANGGMSSCKVAHETPGDYGFGEAALAVAMMIRLAPKTTEGESIAGVRFRVPFVFALAEDEAEEAPEPSGVSGP